MPDVTATYKYPVAETKVVATQTLGCNGANDFLVAATDVTASTTYVADSDPTAIGAVKYAGFGGALKDTDLALAFTSDRRLTGVNVTNTGEGATVVKAAVTLASTAALIALDAHVDSPPSTPAPGSVGEDCSRISDFAGATATGGGGGGGTGGGAPPDPSKAAPKKVVTLTYTVNLLFDPAAAKTISADPANIANTYPAPAADGSLTLLVDPDSAAIQSRITRARFPLIIKVDSATVETTGATWTGHDQLLQADRAPDGFALLKLNRTALVNLSVWGPDKDFNSSIPIWRGQVSVPVHQYYNLPVPSGVSFGKQQFTLSLSDSGAVTKLEYATNTGAADALGAASAIASALPTTVTKTNDLTDEANLIYAQQRLVICRTNPTSCPSK